MTRRLIAILMGATFLVVASAAFAQQWMPGDDHKMHFPQYPNEYGWNVYDDVGVISLADDWECIEPGTINEIHFWGSWQNGNAGFIEGFTITIYDDIPADQSPYDYSIPGAVLWGPEYISAADIEQYHIIPDPEAWEGWYNPLTGAIPWPDHNNYYQYDINDVAAATGIEPFVQTEGAIYWLEIAAEVEPEAAPKYWGWKSSYRHFNDDAVRSGDAGGTPWFELLEPDLGATYNAFHVELDPVGQVVDGWGEFAWDDQWFFYDDDGEWWNIWFFDHPLNYDRWKEVHIAGSYVAADPGIPGDIIIAVNWSTPAWSNVGNPPGEPRRPPMNEDLVGLTPGTYLERWIVYQGPVSAIPQDIGNLGYNINDYNPEWVSIDVRGTNFVFDGAITHQCIGAQPESMDLAFVVGGDPVQDPDGSCCYDNGTCSDAMTQVDCENSGGSYGGDGTTCTGDSDGNGVDDACEGVVPMGACCYGPPAMAMQCVNTTQTVCGQTYHGTWYAGQDCDTFTCPEGDDLKWIQPPDLEPTGMDVFDMAPVILADDFECTETGPITSIDIWGSWWMDEYPNAGPGDIAFTLSIHEDIPATSTVIYPADCPYLTATGSWDIIDGLPVGTEINAVGTLSNFDVTQRESGGEFQGEIVYFAATLELQMVGAGQLAGFTRTVQIPVNCEVHTSCTPPEPCHDFDMELKAMSGELPPGDPDFGYLGVHAGINSGIPVSFGGTTLIPLPGGDFFVDSFFDITYQIEFTGEPGGGIEGLSGVTQGPVRVEQADPSGGPCEVPGEGEHSMPAEAICVYHFGPGDFDFVPEVDPGTITEGWFDPQSGEYIFPGDHNCWKYSFTLPGDCVQEGLPNEPRVYWLDLQAHYVSVPGSIYFGWKTSLSHWNDDAVWATGEDPNMLFSPWLEMWYPPQHQLYGQSVDLAFAVYGETEVDTCLGQMPGDYNNDGVIDNTDLNDLIAYVNDPDPAYEANPKANGDFNGDCRVNSWDVTDMTNFLATGGPLPADCTCLNPYGPCCIGIVGNANLDPGEQVTIGDISVMIDAKFISGTCVGILECFTEADVNLSGMATPDCDDITIGDISTLIDHLFISGPTVLFLNDCY